MTDERDLRVGVPEAAEGDAYHRGDDRSKPWREGRRPYGRDWLYRWPVTRPFMPEWRYPGLWWAAVDSNHVPPRYQHGALPVELAAQTPRTVPSLESRTVVLEFTGSALAEAHLGLRLPGRPRF